MSNKLVLHPSALSGAAAKLRVSASAEVKDHVLSLNYQIEAGEGAPRLVWPASAPVDQRERKDELWKNTCLEAFLYFSDGKYIEINCSPSGDWNVYSFTSYREGMARVEKINRLEKFNASVANDLKTVIYQLSMQLDLAQAVKSPQNFRLGLTAVIESEGGERSYWSLKHPGEKPDFHDSRSYVLNMRI